MSKLNRLEIPNQKNYVRNLTQKINQRNDEYTVYRIFINRTFDLNKRTDGRTDSLHKKSFSPKYARVFDMFCLLSV